MSVLLVQVDAVEVAEMVRRFSKRDLGEEDYVKIERDAHAAIAKFGEDGESLSFEEFCAMVAALLKAQTLAILCGRRAFVL